MTSLYPGPSPWPGGGLEEENLFKLEGARDGKVHECPCWAHTDWDAHAFLAGIVGRGFQKVPVTWQGHTRALTAWSAHLLLQSRMGKLLPRVDTESQATGEEEAESHRDGLQPWHLKANGFGFPRTDEPVSAQVERASSQGVDPEGT